MNNPLNIHDDRRLHNYILEKLSHELGELVKDCYYPRIGSLHRELVHMSGTNDNDLKKYSLAKYGNPKWKILHFPQTVIYVLLAQHFLKKNDYAAALSTINLLSLKFYTNVMTTFIKHCNPDYFRVALRNLSKNHLYNKKDTIGSSLLHHSKMILEKYKDILIKDNNERVYLLVYALRTRIFQSARSFANQYYKAHKAGEQQTTSDEEELYDINLDQKIKLMAKKIADDITLYSKIDPKAKDLAQQITKFNKKLSDDYTKTVTTHKYNENIFLSIYYLLKGMIDEKIDNSKRTNYIDFTKKLMAIKYTKQIVYFKGLILSIHEDILNDLHIMSWFNNLSIQSKATANSFVAYYIALTVSNYIVRD